MSLWNVDVEVTRELQVTVEAETKREALEMAERGPTAWLDESVSTHLYTRATIASRQTSEASEPDCMDAAKYESET